MNIVYITASLPYGPGESFILPEITELVSRGNSVWIVPMHPRGRITHKMGQDILPYCISRRIIDKGILLDSLRFLMKNKALVIKSIRFLLTNNPKHLIKNISIIPKGLWLAGIINGLHIDHIHAHWSATTASLAFFTSKLTGVEWSFTAHRWDIVENNLLERKSHDAKFTRFISESGLSLAKSRFVPDDSKTEVIPMGVPIPNHTMRDKRADFRTILCPANLVPVKGHSILIESFSNIDDKNVELLIAGQGILENELRSLSNRLGLNERVKFLGHLPHDEIIQLYRQRMVDAVVLPSLDLGNGLHEGVPVSLIEAMSYEIPVISTNTGGIPELLHDDAGVIVQANNADSLTSAINMLILDADFRSALGKKGRYRIEEKYSITAVMDKLEFRLNKEKK